MTWISWLRTCAHVLTDPPHPEKGQKRGVKNGPNLMMSVDSRWSDLEIQRSRPPRSGWSDPEIVRSGDQNHHLWTWFDRSWRVVMRVGVMWNHYQNVITISLLRTLRSVHGIVNVYTHAQTHSDLSRVQTGWSKQGPIWIMIRSRYPRDRSMGVRTLTTFWRLRESWSKVTKMVHMRDIEINSVRDNGHIRHYPNDMISLCSPMCTTCARTINPWDREIQRVKTWSPRSGHDEIQIIKIEIIRSRSSRSWHPEIMDFEGWSRMTTWRRSCGFPPTVTFMTKHEQGMTHDYRLRDHDCIPCLYFCALHE